MNLGLIAACGTGMSAPEPLFVNWGVIQADFLAYNYVKGEKSLKEIPALDFFLRDCSLKEISALDWPLAFFSSSYVEYTIGIIQKSSAEFSFKFWHADLPR